MAERILSTSSSFASEVEYAKKHIDSISSAGIQPEYGSAFSLSDDERNSRVSRAEIPLVDPPATTSSNSTSTSDNANLGLTIKSSKPSLSLSLNCSVTASISDLKQQLHAQFKDQGAPEPASQRWIFKGKAMADERLLKEYDGIKDGDTVNLMVKPGTSAATAASTTASQVPAAPATSTTSATTSTSSTPTPSAASAIPPSSPAAATTKSRSDSLSAPFAFTPGSMGPPRSRTTSTSSLTASNGGGSTSNGRGHHARVPSITLTTDFSNFNNLAGNASGVGGSPSPDGYTSPNRSHSRSPSLSTPGNNDPFSASVAAPGSPTIIRSGDSTPLSTPGTPMSGIVGYGRTKSPSISVPIDLDNIDMMMNPLYSSDRTHPVGLSTNFIKTIKDPNVWNDLLGFLDGKFKENDKDGNVEVEGGEHSNDSKRVFEMWLNASKEWMTASDIARIRDSTGVWGLAGH